MECTLELKGHDWFSGIINGLVVIPYLGCLHPAPFFFFPPFCNKPLTPLFPMTLVRT